MTSGRLLALELVSESAVTKWRTLLGPTDSPTAKLQQPTSIRALYGTDNTRNAAHGSDSEQSAKRELHFFFGAKPPVGRCFVGNDTTLAVIKPHALRSRHTGSIVQDILGTFDVTAMEMFTLDKQNAAEFFEAYKGVVSSGEYSSMVEQLTSGSCVALEVKLRGAEGNAVEPLR